MALDFVMTYGKNDGLIMSPSEMLETYFYGIPIIDKRGNTIAEDVFKNYISAAQSEIEKYLGIKLIPQIITEDIDFTFNDWRAWGFLRTTYPVTEVWEMKGFVNTVQQMDMPKEWLSIRETNTDLKYRHIHLLPITSTAIQHSMIYHGVVPLGLFTMQNIPNYWTVVYGTGFPKIPYDLYNFIGKLAAINVFHIMGDLILGAGIASMSIGLDGLSQSISTTSSATNAGYGARIINYVADLKRGLPRLYNYYKGITVLAV